MPILEEIERVAPTELTKIDPTTYKLDYNEHTRVIVGGEESDAYIPEFKIYRFGNEAFFKVTPRGDFSGKTPVEIGTGKVEQVEIEEKGATEKIKVYPVEEADFQEDGAFEFETIFLEKPKSKEVVYDLEYSDNLRFSTISPIDELVLPPEIDALITQRTATEGFDKNNVRRMYQPEKSVNSISVRLKNHLPVYWSKKEADKYQGGKVFHIYRPKLIDALGAEAWADMALDDKAKTLTVTCPQEFLDSAQYPVVVDPTFGYTSLGSGTYTIEDLFNGHVGTPPISAEVTSLHAGLHSDWDSGDNVKMALYDSSDNLVSPQSEVLSGGHSTAQFVSFAPTSGTISVTNQEYVIMAWSDSLVNLRVDYSGDLGDSKFYSLAYGTWPSSPILSNWAWEFSTYATYAPPAPTISGVDDDFVYPGQVDADVDGAGFGASETGLAKVEVANNSVYGSATVIVEQIVSGTWSATNIPITMVIGALTPGTGNYVFVTDSTGARNTVGYEIDFDWEWGQRDPAAVPSQALVNFARTHGGTPPPLDDMILKSVSVYVGTTHDDQVRVAVYQGGSLATGPDGATLLKDFGLTTGSGVSQWLTLNHVGADISINKTDPLWIAFKGNDSGFNYRYNTSGESGDFQSAEGRFASNTVSTDESVAWPATWPSDGGSFGGAWYGMYLGFEIAAGFPDDVYELDDVDAIYEVDATDIEEIYE